MYLFLTVLLLKRTEALQYVLVTTGLKVQPGQPRMRGWEKIPLPVIARDGAQHKGIILQSFQELTADFTTKTAFCLPPHRLLKDNILL